MSILINMEMPKNCGECPFFMDEDFTWCGRADYNICDGRVDRDSKPPWCDLIEIPPHGRLIDADALEELFREVIGNIFKREEITHVLEHMVRASAMVVEMIKDAPTIIEADGNSFQNGNNHSINYGSTTESVDTTSVEADEVVDESTMSQVSAVDLRIALNDLAKTIHLSCINSDGTISAYEYNGTARVIANAVTALAVIRSQVKGDEE